MHASGYCESHEKNMSGLENPQGSAECPRVLSFLSFFFFFPAESFIGYKFLNLII